MHFPMDIPLIYHKKQLTIHFPVDDFDCRDRRFVTFIFIESRCFLKASNKLLMYKIGNAKSKYL